MATARLRVSLTETAAFRRLVMLLDDVERYADEQCDLALKEIVEDCRDDLVMTRGADG